MKTINKILKTQLIILVALFTFFVIYIWQNPISLKGWVDGINSPTPCEILQEQNESKRIEVQILQTKRLINYQERMKND
jgi:hypothetical protein